MPKLAANLLSKATELTATVTGDAEFALKANKCLSTSKLTYCEPDEHLLQIADRPTPPPAEEMTKNKSWMQCAFKNMMEFTVEPLREYTHIGRYEDIPSRIEPFDQGVFTCYGSDGTGAYFYGVSGGRVFCVRLEAYYDFYFAIVNCCDILESSSDQIKRQCFTDTSTRASPTSTTAPGKLV